MLTYDFDYETEQLHVVLAHSATMVKHDIVSYTQSCNITPLSQSSRSIKIANFCYHSKNHQLSWGCILTIVIILMDQGTHVDDYMCMRYIANSQNLSYHQPHCLETARLKYLVIENQQEIMI